MTNENQSFEPRLIVVEHFDQIINEIDIKTETLLQDQSLTEEKRNKLNEIRDEQIEKIKEIKQINLNLLQNEKEELELELEEIINFDCVLLERPTRIGTQSRLGYFDLWITSWYYNQKNLDFLK